MSSKTRKINFEKPKITEIVPIIIHQLKTPISVIRGCLEALLAGDRGKVTSNQKEYLADSLKNIERMSRFIDNLFDISKIENKKFGIELKPVALEKVTAEILKDLSSWFKANNCKVSFEKPKKLAKVLTDSFKIRQVIQNLIANAVIYKEGKGKVDVTLEQKKGKVLFSCRDNGVGIPKKDFKKVFTKFYRSEEAMSLDPSGTGLGLFISKAIIELSEGRIWFESQERKGTTFYFTLPIK